MEVKVYFNKIPEKLIEKWSEFNNSHLENTVFQSPEMFLFYSKVKNYYPYLFISYDSNENINAVLLAVVIKEYKGFLSYFSSRAIVSGGPLIANVKDKAKVLDSLLSKLVGVLKMRLNIFSFVIFLNGRIKN